MLGKVRQAARLRIHPSHGLFACWISVIPFAMALRDNPQARRTIETPPFPISMASLAAMIRRARSSRSGQTARNFCVRSAVGFIENHPSMFLSVDTFIYYHLLISTFSSAWPWERNFSGSSSGLRSASSPGAFSSPFWPRKEACGLAERGRLDARKRRFRVL